MEDFNTNSQDEDDFDYQVNFKIEDVHLDY